MPPQTNVSEFEIPINLTFQNPATPALLIADVLESVNNAVYESESDELEALSQRFSDLPQVTLDAARYRIENYRQTALLIESGSKGSLIVLGTTALLALWLLDKTLGETIKEAWKQDEWHNKLKDYLTENLAAKANAIAENIRRQLQSLSHHRPWRRRSDRRLELSVEVQVSLEPGKARIMVGVKSLTQDLPPSQLSFRASTPKPPPENPEDKRKK